MAKEVLNLRNINLEIEVEIKSEINYITSPLEQGKDNLIVAEKRVISTIRAVPLTL